MAESMMEPVTQWPPERIPKEPVLSGAAFRGGRRASLPSLLDAGDAVFVTRGSMAIALALCHAKIGAGDEVLLPAYHCVAMVDPVVWRGAIPVFYQVGANTAVDLDDIAARVGPKTRAMLVTHYFGFHQDMAEIRAFCDARGLILIEDCAHAFFGVHSDRPIGSFGDYGIGSIWKFFPVYEGGCLVSNRHRLSDLQMRSSGVVFGAKAFVNTLQRAFEYDRLATVERVLSLPMRCADAIWQRLKSSPITDSRSGSAHSADTSNPAFSGDWVRRRMSLSSRMLMRAVSMQRVVERRLANYRLLLKELQSVEGAEPLFPVLPPGVVPQVFPLRVFDPGRVFPLLKRAGVPVIRFGEFLWPSVDPKRYVATAALSRQVFQLPCHQELTEIEIDWLVKCTRTALRGLEPAAESRPACHFS